MTRGAFAKRLAKELDIPFTVHNRIALATWMQTEGGDAWFNPLNTTQDMPGATAYNWVGVKNYVSAEQGIDATVKTFRYRGHGYERILRSMRINAPARKTVRIIGGTDWGTGQTLMAVIRAEIARKMPWYLRQLEQRSVAGP